MRLRTKSEEQTVNPAPGRTKQRNKNKEPALRLATWNVRTMCPGLSHVLQQVDDARKTAIINDELKRLKIHIAALQETRLASNGCIRESDYTFFWQGKAPEETRINGVGFAVKNSLLSSIEPPSEGSARMLSLRLTSTSGPVTIMSVYAPTLCSEEYTKDKFYEELD